MSDSNLPRIRKNNCKICNADITKERYRSRNYCKVCENLYGRFCKIKERCYNEKCKSYKNYGSRGIKVCDDWMKDPNLFIKWSLNNGYKPILTIDRINNNGMYSPLNCRWVSTIQQNRNYSRNKLKIQDVLKIKQMISLNCYSNIEISRKFNCSADMISKIKNNKSWEDIKI